MADDKVPAYGEDAEAKALQKPATPGTTPAKVPPDVAMPASGTTETDLARNIAQASDRKAKMKE